MYSRRKISAFTAGAGGIVLATAFAACSIFGGAGVGPSGSGASATPSVGGGLPAWLASALGLPDASASAGSSGASTWPGSSGIADASTGPGGTAGPGTAATPGIGATAAPTATALPPAPTPAPTPPPAPAAPCYVFPSSNVWNRPVNGLAVASNSAAMISAIGAGSPLHPDFDAVGDGIPFNIVTTSTPGYTVGFDYADESDPGPYPIPSNPRIESGSDRHLLSLDLGQCKLWELYDAQGSGSSWTAGSGAFFDLHSNALRPEGWTSADAAGLPIFPGLVRYAEMLTGSIDHALRFTAPHTCGYIYPARHLTAPPCSNLPPMGLRVRLKASVDISGFGPHAQIVLTTLKKYGMILADNGSPWYVSGSPDSRWDDDEFHKFNTLTGNDFEVVDTGGLRNG
jgi:hypothetical protein